MITKFTFNNVGYYVEISKVKRYNHYINLLGITIGFGNYTFVKKITFGHSGESVLIGKNYHRSYSFARDFIRRLEQELRAAINEHDIITFFAVTTSRQKIADFILQKNGWSKVNDCYFKKAIHKKLYRPVIIFRILMIDRTY